MEVSITHVPHLNGNPTPARCNRRTGEIWINDSVWYTIPPAHRMFILLHEYGHIQLNTSDELAVDAFASKLYVQMGYSLTDSVKSLSRVLTGKSPQHIQRVAMQLKRAKEIDQKNQNMCQTNSLFDTCRCENCTHNFSGDPIPWYNQTADDFGGCDASKLKPRQYRKCVRVEGKSQTKVTKAEGTKALKEGKGAGMQAKGEAKRILSEQGIVDNADSGLNGLVRTAGKAFGKTTDEGPVPATNNNNKILMWVGIGIAAVAVIGTIIFLFKRSK